jgi:hypothetical protein
MKMSWRTALAATAAVVVAACSNASGPAQPTDGPGSASLTVAITSPQFGCYPKPTTPCRVTVEAVVADSGGRPLTYNWSGCASGTARIATCVVLRPGDVAVSVRVTDDRAQFGDATATATGTNLPPVVEIYDSVLSDRWDATRGIGSIEVYGRHDDPELGSGCPYSRVIKASGICTQGSTPWCTGGDLTISVIKAAPSGECTFTLTGVDQWGLAASVTKTFTLPVK